MMSYCVRNSTTGEQVGNEYPSREATKIFRDWMNFNRRETDPRYVTSRSDNHPLGPSNYDN